MIEYNAFRSARSRGSPVKDIVSFGFQERLEGVFVFRAHRDADDVNIPIDGDDFVERVRHSRDSFVSVDGLKLLRVHGVVWSSARSRGLVW